MVDGNMNLVADEPGLDILFGIVGKTRVRAAMVELCLASRATAG